MIRTAIVGVVWASAVSAQQTIIGTYHSRSITLEFTATGQARFSNAFGLLIAASYQVTGDTISLRDESGQAACPGVTGRYLWRVDPQALRFQLVADLCATRRTQLARPWSQGGRLEAAAAELTPVLVTAQRQVEDAQRAPVSIAVLSADLIRDAGITQPQSLTYLTPGVQTVTGMGNSASIYMRGVGNAAGNSLQDPTVTFNFDGVYIARPTATSGLYYDLERIEVLKGPQGTLYGRNATGGAVNILPRRPVLGVYSGEVNSEYGGYNTFRMDGAVNVPVGERAAFRIAGQRVGHNAYMTDGTDDQNDWAGRASFRYDATDALTVHMVADYYGQGGHGPGSTPIEIGVDNRFGVSSPEAGAYYEKQRVTIAGRNWTPVAQMERANNHHWGINATMNWRTALGEATLVPSSRGSNLDLIASPSGNLLTLQEHSRQTSIEGRLASEPHPRLQTLVGVFYFDEDITTPDRGVFRPYNQFNYSLQQPQSGVTSNAAFGRVTLRVSDRLRTTLGARYTHESKSFGGSYQSFQKLCVQPPPGCPNVQPFPVDVQTPALDIPRDSASRFNPADGTMLVGFRIVPHESARFSRTTWRTALDYDVASSAHLYATYETGFKSGGFFFSNDAQVYQPEYLGAFTLGLKSRLLGDRLQANLELFDWSYRDQQISMITIDSRNATNLRIQNVGRTKIRGGEASLEFTPLANTQLSADVQRLDATYVSDVFHTSVGSVGPSKSECVVTTVRATPPMDFIVDCSGRRAPFSPEWTHNLGARQALPLRKGANLIAEARAHHQSKTLVGGDFTEQEQQSGYWMLDGSLTLATPDKRHSVGVFGQNLTNKTVMSNAFTVPFSGFPVTTLRPPRVLGVRVDARF